MFFKEKRRALYYSSIILPVIFIIVVEKLGDSSIMSTPIVITIICALILTIVAKKSNANEGFIVNATKSIQNSVIAPILALVVGLIAQSIVFSLDVIFSTDIAKITKDTVIYLAFFGVTPAIFLFFEYKENRQNIKQSNFLNIVINFIVDFIL